jgi:hypothetical protein
MGKKRLSRCECLDCHALWDVWPRQRLRRDPAHALARRRVGERGPTGRHCSVRGFISHSTSLNTCRSDQGKAARSAKLVSLPSLSHEGLVNVHGAFHQVKHWIATNTRQSGMAGEGSPHDMQPLMQSIQYCLTPYKTNSASFDCELFLSENRRIHSPPLCD